MSRIKLRQLLNLTEQAPQPPMGDPLAPAPAPIAPPPGMNAGGQDDQQTPTPTPDTSPEPEDPGEYDFTKDFRAFEDKKNKAEADAKKVLLDKMNEKLLGKTIVANASRGYGQPKTDYTIKAVKKVSVEFWYKDYVVIVSDENDKKYFLTPGINIKIEGSEPAPGGEQAPAPDSGQPEQPQADQATAANEPGGQETPNGTPPPAQEPQGVTPQAPETEPTPAPGAPAPAPQQPGQPPQTAPVPPKKKKKLPVAEWVQKDLSKFLLEFMSEDVKNEYGNVDFISYIKRTSEMLSEGINATKIKVELLIPENHMIKVDKRDIKLAAISAMMEKSYNGQYSKGSIELTNTGRYYLLEYVKEIGRNI